MQTRSDKKSLEMLSSAALGGAAAVVLAMLLLTVLAGVLLLTDDPGSYAWAGGAVMLLCCFAGSFAGGRCTEKRPFFAGLLGGAMFFLTVLIASLILSAGIRAFYIPAALCCIALGAFLGSIRRGGTIPAFDDRRFRKFGS
ncbi:MAG: TIGR04086 family membrane protein [Clostridia bacterium]|nr:TIGR04086 family membrane protein [Clostridia bacterium]